MAKNGPITYETLSDNEYPFDPQSSLDEPRYDDTIPESWFDDEEDEMPVAEKTQHDIEWFGEEKHDAVD